MRWLSDETVERLRGAADLPDLSGTSYQLIRKVASGGMSTVYLAQDPRLGRKVAIKVMRLDPTGELASRIIREAKIVAQLEHPSIVPVHDVGNLPDGRIFYAMKLVNGRRLDQYVKTGAFITDMLRVFQKVCEAVAFAHAYGVIHRDLKPENIMVGSFGEVLVMDWGVAKVLDRDITEPIIKSVERSHGDRATEESETLFKRLDVDSELDTAYGTVIGTPSYMAPEQALGQTDRIDQKTDVYALGAILYFMLTGRPAFGGGRPDKIRRRLITEVPERPRKLNPTLARSLEAVCLRAISKDPEKRYPSAQEMASDIARFLDGLPVSAYRENIFERAGRFLNQNQFIVILVLVYLLMRVLVAFFAAR